MRISHGSTRHGQLVAVLLLAIFCATCAEAPTPIEPEVTAGLAEPADQWTPGVIGEPSLSGAIACRASVAGASVSCGELASRGTSASAVDGGPSYVMLGGQGAFVNLSSTNVSYDPGTEEFSFDVTVTNLIGQVLGTEDGTTPDGVMIFFEEAPLTLGGTGAITVAGDGTGSFTSSDQPYYAYSGMLATNATSAARHWTLNVPATVTDFAFTVYVNAPVDHENGWIELSAADSTLDLGDADLLTTSLSIDAFDVIGNPLAEEPTLESSAPAVATVDSETGLVTAVGPGSTTITASARGDTITASLDIEVVQAPANAVITLTEDTLTADGVSTTDATVTIVDGLGHPMPDAVEAIDIAVTGINDNTPGATIDDVSDAEGATFVVTLIAPVNNGSGELQISHATAGLLADTTIAYIGGNNIPLARDSTIHGVEDDTLTFDLPPTDQDDDPLTYHLIRKSLQNAAGSYFADASLNEYRDEGNPDPNAIDVTTSDPTIRFVPAEDAYGPVAKLYYTVSDGQSTSNEVEINISFGEGNDIPTPTLSGTLTLYEDEPLHFFMKGFDEDHDRFRIRLVHPPELHGLLIHNWTGGEYLVYDQTILLAGVSDTAWNWPMTFKPFADDFDAVSYNSFSYWLEEVYTGSTIHSPETTVTFVVLPVNDAPHIEIAGVDSLPNYDLATTLVTGGTYELPTLGVTDKEIPPSSTSPYSITIETSGNGTIALDPTVKSIYEAVPIVFTTTPTSISFEMPFDVSAYLGLGSYTLDNLLTYLTYTPGAVGTDTLTLTVDDQGSSGSCTAGESSSQWGDPPTASAPAPCAKQAVMNVAVDIVAGTPPAEATEMVLTDEP